MEREERWIRTEINQPRAMGRLWLCSNMDRTSPSFLLVSSPVCLPLISFFIHNMLHTWGGELSHLHFSAIVTTCVALVNSFTLLTFSLIQNEVVGWDHGFETKDICIMENSETSYMWKCAGIQTHNKTTTSI